MARLDLLTQADLPDDYQYLLDENAMGEINLLCAMSHNPEVLQSYMRYGSTLWADGGLDSADLELCILGIARALDARYEWHQHVPIARNQGLEDDEILAVAHEDYDHFNDLRATLLRYVRAVALGDVNDETYDALVSHVDESTVVGVTSLVTHYLATARFIDALDVPLETDFIGWNLSGEA